MHQYTYYAISSDPTRREPEGMADTFAPTAGPTLFLSSTDVTAAFDWAAAVEALRAAYAGPVDDAMFPPRSMARGPGLWLRTLSGIAADGGLMGAKLIAANVRNRRASYLIPLFDQETVELRALLDGNAITGFRTAATTALAVDALTRTGAVAVGVLGSGFEARNHIRALAALRVIASVQVFSPNPASRAAFAASLADLGLPVTGCDSARALVEAGSDILLCAARSRDETPLFDGDWLQPGTTLASIGSTLPEQRELDPRALDRAALIVADMPEEVVHDTGDMIAARAAGVALEGRMVSLADLIGGRHPGRGAGTDIVIYKSVGGALQDLAVAAMCFHRARALGLGQTLTDTIRPVAK
jgi:alanine dehydrogenase